MTALRTPLYDWHVSHGGRMVDFAGWSMPVQYTGVVAEHKAVRESAGLFDISHMGRFSIGGADALAIIDKNWTNDAASMKDGQVRYGLVCDESGGILDDILVYRWPYGWSMVVNASNRLRILDHIQKLAVGSQFQIDDRTTATGMIAIQGPSAVAMCAGMFDHDPSLLKYYFAQPTRWQGHQCVVSRTGYTGEDGLEVIMAAEPAQQLWEILVGKGAVPCGLGARDTLRLEAAMPLYGHELNESTDPYQAGLNWAVKPAKGDFVGKTAILKRNEDPKLPKRIGLVLEGTRSAREGCKVISGEKAVGAVTSGAPAPTVGKPIAMAYVDPAAATPGTELTIDIRGQSVAARVVPLPFYQRKKN